MKKLSTGYSKEVTSNFKQLTTGQIPQTEQNSQILKELFQIKKISVDLTTMINNLETKIKTPRFSK